MPALVIEEFGPQVADTNQQFIEVEDFDQATIALIKDLVKTSNPDYMHEVLSKWYSIKEGMVVVETVEHSITTRFIYNPLD